MSKLARKGTKPLLLSVLMTGLLAVPTGIAAHADTITPLSASAPNTLQDAFDQASQEFNVPESVLMSVAYNETRWEQHEGQMSMAGGYGVMHLTDVNAADTSDKGDTESASGTLANDASQHSLEAAAQLLGEDPSVLKADAVQNIRGGAALLAEYARETVGGTPTDASQWYGAVAKYSGSSVDVVATGFADDVYSTIQQGEDRTTTDGQHAVLSATQVTPDKNTASSLHLRNANKSDVDCPNGLDCQYIPALYAQFSSDPGNYGNYDLGNRPNDGDTIRYIIIHDAEENYQDTIKTFLQQTYTSANYIVDSSTGQVTEMVRPENVAWQAGNWYINSHSVGIEHSGYAAEGGTWYTEQMYRASAKLVKYLAAKYNVPLDRQHILGHDNVPGTSTGTQSSQHWDPAAYWDWSHYFDLLGASFNQANGQNNDSQIVTINVNYQTNEPPLTYQGSPLVPQPSDFVYLYTAPSFEAPLVSDPALHPNGSAGTTAINDWGDKAVQGDSYYVADQQGDWTAIYYGGQKAWFYNPKGANTVSGHGILLTPKAGLTSIPVYGTAYPEASAFGSIPVRTNRPLQYTIPAGQMYVSSGEVPSDYYYAVNYNQPTQNKVVQGQDMYYEISFNHRVAFVKATDVDVVANTDK